MATTKYPLQETFSEFVIINRDIYTLFEHLKSYSQNENVFNHRGKQLFVRLRDAQNTLTAIIDEIDSNSVLDEVAFKKYGDFLLWKMDELNEHFIKQVCRAGEEQTYIAPRVSPADIMFANYCISKNQSSSPTTIENFELLYFGLLQFFKIEVRKRLNKHYHNHWLSEEERAAEVTFFDLFEYKPTPYERYCALFVDEFTASKAIEILKMNEIVDSALRFKSEDKGYKLAAIRMWCQALENTDGLLKNKVNFRSESQSFFCFKCSTSSWNKVTPRAEKQYKPIVDAVKKLSKLSQHTT